jgi:protoporphyrinogen oxidase
MKVGIIGAGPAGLSAAYQLTKEGVKVEVFESADAVGGLAKTFSLWGQKVDLGPHRYFCEEPRVNRLWFEMVGNDYRMIGRLTRIYYRGRYFYYPLVPLNALWNMGLFEAACCLASYAAERIAHVHQEADDSTFESWVVGRFGRRLYEMFFKSYTEKLWGIPCGELDADFAKQRIRKFSMAEVVKGALGFSRGGHKTLVDCFAYPIEGAGMVYRRMAEFVCQAGGSVHLNSKVRRVTYRNRRVDGLELDDGQLRPFDHVISTMPVTSLARGLGVMPEPVADAVGQLHYRNTILVYLSVDGKEAFRDQWLYVHSPELRTGRVTNFRNWVPELYGDAENSILALEYWCNDRDPRWLEQDDRLIELARREIVSTGLVDANSIQKGHVVRIARSYPIYRQGYREQTARLAEYLDDFAGLMAIGRGGAFKYNNQDHSMLMGILAAENLLYGKENNLWDVNSDSDTYQEAAAAEELRPMSWGNEFVNLSDGQMNPA